ncbi:MAG TPA: hypothetical protein DCZ92_05645 [Elusimicrobia bacterium]|nr:MAG: hypothetical protein A2016_06850 [Elusimicrobia bacterium GWF2_62_30]HBA60289.1 hypothetical protein [Elusimicrobiota bacterium]
MARAQQDLQSAESSFTAARFAGAETYSITNLRTSLVNLQSARTEFAGKKYTKATLSAQSSLYFSKNAISETEVAKRHEAEAKRIQEEEARREAAIKEQEKADAKAKAAKKAKPAVKAKVTQPAAKTTAAPPAPAAQKKEEPKKKSWW